MANLPVQKVSLAYDALGRFNSSLKRLSAAG